MLKTVARHTADAGLIEPPLLLCSLIVTVFSALTKPQNIKPDSRVDGAPKATVAPTSAPVTVIVNCSVPFEPMLGKSKVAVAVTELTEAPCKPVFESETLIVFDSIFTMTVMGQLFAPL